MGDDRFVKNGKFQRLYRRKGRQNYHPAGTPPPAPPHFQKRKMERGENVEMGRVIMRTPVVVDRSVKPEMEVARAGRMIWGEVFYALAVIAIAIVIGGTVVGILFR